MKAIQLTHFGDVSSMQYEECPLPHLKQGEILIKVEAAGINRPDIIQRQGHYPAPKGASEILGLEIAGTVVEITTSSSKYQIGDKVCGLVSGGGYAQYAAIHEDHALPIPKGLSITEAASLPETFFTVWSNLMDRAQLSDGQSLLIHGGSSGIGITAIQLAKQLKNATIFATAQNEEKCTAIKELGAIPINYLKQDYVDFIKQYQDDNPNQFNQKGVDVILDMVGGDYINKNIKIAANDATIVNIAYLNGAIAEVNFMPVMLKRLNLTGSTLRIRSNDFKAEITQNLLKHVWPLLEAGKIKPVIDQVFNIENVQDAHQRMEKNQHIGKIVLKVDHS